MRILVLEDDERQQGRIEETLLTIAKERNLRLTVDIATSYKDLERYVAYFDHYQLYFLDLEVDGDREMGFKVAQGIRERDPFTSIVFVTTHSESLPLAFRYHLSALDFISKDQTDTDYRAQLERCLDYVIAQDTRENSNIFSYSYEGRRGFSLPYHDILAIETTTESHRLCIYSVNNTSKMVYGSLSDVAKKSKKGYLVYANRNVLVSIHAVKKLTSSEVILIDDLTFPISRKGKNILRNSIKNRH